MISARWLLVLLLIGPRVSADDPSPAPTRRVISGRCVTAQGEVPQGGRIAFRPNDQVLSFTEAWTASLDAEGRYRIELVDAIQRSLDGGKPVTASAGGPLRFEVFAPGYRSEVGTVNAPPRAEPLPLNVQLTPQPWRETEWQLLDAAGQPVRDGEVKQVMRGGVEWATLRTDRNGVCRVSNPPGRAYEITARRPGSVRTIVRAMGTADEPPRILVPIREPVRGRVVDPSGKPVADLRIGRLVTTNDWTDEPAAGNRSVLLPFARSEPHPRTDPDGRFQLDLPLRIEMRGTVPRSGELRLFPQPVCFAAAAGHLVAFLSLDRRNPRPAYDLTLAPTRPVRIPVEHAGTSTSGQRQTSWELVARTDALGASPPIYIASGLAVPDGGRDRVEVTLPPGSYEMQIQSGDPVSDKRLGEAGTKFDVVAGEGELVLPALTLAPPALDELVGKPAPELAARDLDVGAPVRLADLRGRVVVLDFWGYWCGPCLGALPELVKLHDEFAGQPVTIVAVHDQSIQTRAAFDIKLGSVRRKDWNDRDLPFRVAFDQRLPDLKPDDLGLGDGVTARRYAVAVWPTTFLIDQGGQVVGTIDVRDRGAVSARIKTLLATPPGR